MLNLLLKCIKKTQGKQKCDPFGLWWPRIKTSFFGWTSYVQNSLFRKNNHASSWCKKRIAKGVTYLARKCCSFSGIILFYYALIRHSIWVWNHSNLVNNGASWMSKSNKLLYTQFWITSSIHWSQHTPLFILLIILYFLLTLQIAFSPTRISLIFEQCLEFLIHFHRDFWRNL